MEMLNPEFIAFVAAALILFHAARAPWWRDGVLACASLVFALSYAGNGKYPVWTSEGALSLIPLAAFALAGFAAVRAAKSLPAWPLALDVIAAYALLRYLPGMADDPDRFTTIGLSYILFRVLHLLFDNSQAALAPAPTLSGYLAYLFLFPTFLAGPIWRYDEYHASRKAAAGGVLDEEKVFLAFSRLADGCLKILVLTWACAANRQAFAEAAALADSIAWSAAYFSLAALAHLLVFYFDFSGYMDIVVGVGALFGLTLPENFNSPFQSADLIDFWNRWHITLSKWMQQYVFIPLVARLSRRFLGRVKIQYLGAAGYLAVFLLVGVWHGASLGFACFGLILGLAASATKLWDYWLARIFPGKAGKAVKNHPVYRCFMNALSIFIVALALSPLWVEAGVYARFSLFFAICGLAAGLLGAGALSVLDRFFREIASWLERPGRLKLGDKVGKTAASLGSELWLASRCLAVFGLVAMQNSDVPAFIYRGF